MEQVQRIIVDSAVIAWNQRGKQGMPKGKLFQCANDGFFPPGRVVLELCPKLEGADGCPNGNGQDSKLWVSPAVCIMEDFGDGAHLQAGQADGGTLAKSRWRKAPAEPKQFLVDICFKFYMPSVVPAVLPCEFRFPIDIRVAAGI